MLKSQSPLLFAILAFLLLAELLMDGIAPFILPENFYLYYFLSSKARERTLKIPDDADEFLVYDAVVGWRSRPGVAREKWQIDAQGARTTHAVSYRSTRKRYILFLGSSLTNGGTHLNNSETISAYVEDAETESINFGTMLYSPDQSYLLYKYRLQDYQTNVVVVGLRLPDDLDGLTNQYVPFRSPGEYRIPYFKPRLVVQSGESRIVPVPPKTVYASLFSDPGILGRYDRNDQFYSEFEAFKFSGFLPISGGIHLIYQKIRNFAGAIEGKYGALPLLDRLLKDFAEEGEKRGAQVLFMILPDREAVSPGAIKRHLPDHYGRMVAHLMEEGYNIVDGRAVFRKSGYTAGEIFYEDNSHFSSLGNLLIAKEIKKALAQGIVMRAKEDPPSKEGSR